MVKAAIRFGAVIVVDDGSADDTITEAETCGALVLPMKKNQGYEASLISGLEFAVNSCRRNSEIILCLDGDGEHPAEAIMNVAKVTRISDLVIGKRSRLNRFAEHLGSYYSIVRYGIPDPFCGMRAFKVGFLRQFLDSACGYNLGLGPIAFAKSSNKNVSSVPIEVGARVDVSRFGAGLLPNMKLMRSIIQDLV